MSGMLAHRGPDREGLWCGDIAALGHRAFLTTSVSAREQQPLIDPNAPLALVADARIDNREELASALGLRLGPVPADGDIILAAYRRWGMDCADRLIGDFAFAIWDAREHRLFCARDPMGVKPFYYYRNDRRFAFASEIKALRTLSDCDEEVDPEQVAMFVGLQFDDRERTIYRGVKRLPAAHTLHTSADTITVRRYWSPDAAREVRFQHHNDYADCFRETFKAAVSARLRSAHTVGATLSGGLDSSSIVCMTRQLRTDGDSPLHTFSLVFPELRDADLRAIDERSYMDAVVRLGGIEPHLVRGDALSPLRDVNRTLWHLDEPHSAPNLYLHWGMYEAAQQNGVRVLLDGFDGDSVVSHGFLRLTGLARARNWSALEAEVRASSAVHAKPVGLLLEEYVLPRLGELAASGRFLEWWRLAREMRRRFRVSRLDLLRDHGTRPAFASLRSALSPALDEDAAFASSFLQPTLADALRRHCMAADRDARRRPIPTEREAHGLGLAQPLYQLTLETADKSAAAFGVEPRYPFFDRRLIEFCMGVPDDQKFRDGWPRRLLRKGMQGVLPPEIQWRATKANLGPNFYHRFRAADIDVLAASNTSKLARYVRSDTMQRTLERYRAAAPSDRMTREALTLFRVGVLGTWLAQPTNRIHRTPCGAATSSPAAA